MVQDRSNLLAKTFLLPQQQVNYQQPVQQPYDDGVQALEGLQVVQGQTTDYYKKVSALKSFMQSVNKNLGIDVRVPDLSRPESIELNQIYQKALADILAQGNELKQSSGIYSMLINRGDHLTKGAYDKPAARFQHGVDYYGGVDKAITETNDFTSTPSYSKEEYDQKLAVYNQRKQEYEKLRDENPDKKEYYDYQLRALTPPAQRQYRPYNDSSASDRSFERKVKAAGNWLTKTGHLLVGAHDSYKIDDKHLTSRGTPYLISTEFVGTNIGGGTLQYWRFNPNDDTIDMMVKTKDGIVPVDVTGQDPQTIATTLSKLPPEALIEYAEKNKLYDDYQQIDRNKLLGKDYQTLIKTNKDKTLNTVTTNAMQLLTDDISKLQNRGWFTDDDRLQVGKFRIVKRKGNKYEIENIKEAMPLTNRAPKDATHLWSKYKFWEATDAGTQDLINFLVSQGAHLDYYKTKYPGETVKPGTQIAPQQPANNAIDW